MTVSIETKPLLMKQKYLMNRLIPREEGCLVPRPPYFVTVEPFRVTWSDQNTFRGGSWVSLVTSAFYS